MNAYTYRRASDGWDVLLDGEWVGWTAGSRRDAVEMVAGWKRDAPPRYFLDSDGHDDTLWLEREGRDPLAILRECDLPSSARHLWATFVAAAIEVAR